MGRVLIASFLGAIVCFTWGAASWMMLDWHSSSLRTFDNEEVVAKTLAASAPEHGVYMLPHTMEPKDRNPSPQSRAAAEKAKADLKAGPFVYAVVRPGPKKQPFPMDLTFVWAFLRSVAACFIVSLMVRQMVEAGATRVRVLPLFFGMGKHAREDLPVLMKDLTETHPTVRFEQLPAAGEDPRLTALLAQIALEIAP